MLVSRRRLHPLKLQTSGCDAKVVRHVKESKCTWKNADGVPWPKNQHDVRDVSCLEKDFFGRWAGEKYKATIVSKSYDTPGLSPDAYTTRNNVEWAWTYVFKAWGTASRTRLLREGCDGT